MSFSDLCPLDGIIVMWTAYHACKMPPTSDTSWGKQTPRDTETDKKQRPSASFTQQKVFLCKYSFHKTNSIKCAAKAHKYNFDKSHPGLGDHLIPLLMLNHSTKFHEFVIVAFTWSGKQTDTQWESCTYASALALIWGKSLENSCLCIPLWLSCVFSNMHDLFTKRSALLHSFERQTSPPPLTLLLTLCCLDPMQMFFFSTPLWREPPPIVHKVCLVVLVDPTQCTKHKAVPWAWESQISRNIYADNLESYQHSSNFLHPWESREGTDIEALIVALTMSLHTFCCLLFVPSFFMSPPFFPFFRRANSTGM